MQPLVSIIVPVYNSEKYLDECINSIKSQTYKNLEIILVNDGSKDNSLAKCNEYASKDSRIEVIDKVNGGASSARNKGLEKASGKFIVFIDSDDVISHKMIENLYFLVLEYHTEIAICEIERFTSEVKNRKDKNKASQNIIYSGNEYLRQLILGNTDCSPCNKIYSKEVVGNTRFIEGRINEDKLFLFDIYQKCNTIIKTNEILKALYDACMETRAIDKSNFDIKQYKADLQCAYDCGYCAGKSDKVEQEPFINKPCVSEGACKQHTATVLDKIRAEIEYIAKDYDKFEDLRRVRGLWIAIEIIDKYRTGSEK